MLIFDPLEQFAIAIYSSFFYIISFYSFSSIGLMVCFICFIIMVFFNSLTNVFLLNKYQKKNFLLFKFFLGVLKDSLSIKKYSFVLIFFSGFLFILISNLLGMAPYSMTITSRF